LRIEKTSRLGASPAEVWRHATRLSSINREMRPWMTMRPPREHADTGIDAAPVGEPLFACWVLAGGIVPIERMQLCLLEVGPGYRFVEGSRVSLLRSWRHERTVEPDGDGCRVTDRLEFASRWFLPPAALAAVLTRFFDHRHRRLAALFGSTEL
jgi:ligand-binding SRPBCC domain-containing protein